MYKINNEEFFEGITKDIKERENKEYGKFDDFNVLKEGFDEIYKSFFDKEEKNPLENSNNVYVECEISKEEAMNGCNKTIQVKRKQDGKNEEAKIRVKIPQNIQNGNKIILSKEGNVEKSNIGNLVVEVKIK